MALELTRYGFWRDRVKNWKLTKLPENHKMMPTCKHIDISTVLQSNMNSELDKGRTWLSKKKFH